MKIIKESVTINRDLYEFMEEHRQQIEDFQLEQLFEDASSNFNTLRKSDIHMLGELIRNKYPNCLTKLNGIPKNFFCESDIESVDIPNNIEYIDDYAFWECRNLKTINWSDNITSIGDASFFKCDKLTELKLPPNLETIGPNAFTACRALKNVYFPDTIESTYKSSFDFCSINNVYVDGNEHDYRFIKDSFNKTPGLKFHFKD